MYLPFPPGLVSRSVKIEREAPESSEGEEWETGTGMVIDVYVFDGRTSNWTTYKIDVQRLSVIIISCTARQLLINLTRGVLRRSARLNISEEEIGIGVEVKESRVPIRGQTPKTSPGTRLYLTATTLPFSVLVELISSAQKNMEEKVHTQQENC